MINTIMDRALNAKFTLIAEIGVNYYDIAERMNISLMDAAKKMIDEAKKVGIHAVKFQTYKAETLAAKQSPTYWDTKEEPTTSQYELFHKFDHFSYQEYNELSQYCNEIAIEFLSTPFDIESADYLNEMMNVYKISSSDLNNIPFIKYQALKRKPILLSIGASNEDEIDTAIQTIRQYNQQPLTLLHCVLEYPTPYSHANLNKIISLKTKYPDCIIGYSDHTKPEKELNIIKTAYNLGACVIEKHFTLDKTIKGNDHYHAMDPTDAKRIIEEISVIDTIRGSYELQCLDSENQARKHARRSLVTTCNITKGTVITRDMLTFKRPGHGISPSELDIIIGKTARQNILCDTTLLYEMV